MLTVTYLKQCVQTSKAGHMLCVNYVPRPLGQAKEHMNAHNAAILVIDGLTLCILVLFSRGIL